MTKFQRAKEQTILKWSTILHLHYAGFSYWGNEWMNEPYFEDQLECGFCDEYSPETCPLPDKRICGCRSRGEDSLFRKISGLYEVGYSKTKKELNVLFKLSEEMLDRIECLKE